MQIITKMGVRDYFKKQKVLLGPKTIFFYTGTKNKMRHICKD
jgi:hypothetical protein